MRVRSMVVVCLLVGAVLATGGVTPVSATVETGATRAASGAGRSVAREFAAQEGAPTSPLDGPVLDPTDRWPASASSPSEAAAPEVTSDRDFDPATSYGERVDAVALQDDGRILMAGDFGDVGGANRPNLARLLPDGEVDRSFRNAQVRSVRDLAVLDDGRILIVGDFGSVGGGIRRGVARLNADGTLDTSLPDIRVGGPVNSVLLQPDGSALIGGDFTTVEGVAQQGVARLHPDGTLDATFANPGVDVAGIGRDGVREIALDDQGRVLAAGDFETVAGSAHPSIVRLLEDGTVDPSFTAPTIAAGDGLLGVTVQPDGKVVVNGAVTAVAGSMRRGVARLLADGGLDTTFVDPGVAFGAATVADVALQDDGRLVLAGDFVVVGGQARRNVARLLANGALDTSLGNPVFDEPARTVVLQPDGKVLVGGDFYFVEGRLSTLLARLRSVSIEPLGALDPSFGGDGVVQSALVPSQFALDVAIQPDGRIVSAGSASSRGGSLGVMRHEPDGDLDPTFGGGDGGVETDVTSANDWAEGVALQADGKIVVAGHAGTGPSAGFVVARYRTDGTLDPTFSGDGRVVIDFGAGTEIAYDLVVQPDGRIVVAGVVGGRGGQFGLARLRRTGTLDPTFGGDGRVVTDFTAGQDWANAVGLRPDGRIVAAGGAIGTSATVALARYRTDGSLDTAFGTRGRQRSTFGGPSVATALALQPDGRLVVAGVGEDEGVGLGVARYLPSGARDLGFSAGGNAIYDITSGEDDAWDVVVQADGAIVVVGSAAVGGGAFVAVRQRPDGRIDTDWGTNGSMVRDLTAGPDVAFAAALQTDGKLVMAGGSGTAVGQVTLTRHLT